MHRLPIRSPLLLFALLVTAVLAAWGQRGPRHPVVDPRHVTLQSPFRAIDLTGAWLVHEGDDPRFADPGLDDSGWQTIEVDRPLAAYGIAAPTLLWYRTHVELPADAHDMAILLRGFTGSEQIFVNGVLTGPSRPFPAGGLASSSYEFHRRIPEALLHSGRLTIAVRAELTRAGHTVWHAGFSPDSLLLLGDATILNNENYLFVFRDITSNVVILAVTGFVLLIAIALALTLPEEHEYLALCVLLAGMIWLSSESLWRITRDAVPTRWSHVGSDGVSLLTLLAGIEFARIILRLPRARWIVGYEGALAGLALVSAAASVLMAWQQPSGRFVIVRSVCSIAAIAPVNLGLPLFALWTWWRRRNFDALLLSVPLLVRSFFLYGELAFLYGAVFHLTSGHVPKVPGTIFNIGWTEIGDFFFLIALLLFLIVRTVRLARSRAALTAEIAAARSIQQLLLSHASQPTPGFRVDSVYLPAAEVGGDFFLVSPHPDAANKSIVAVVGDVSGKGLLAAMRVSMILGVLRRESSRNPAEILANLNEALLTQGESGFTTAVCVSLEGSGAYSVANAGHISPFVASHQSSHELETCPALPLGLAGGQSYELARGQLAAGQRLVLMSDGIPEARAKDGTLYGFDRLPHLTQMSAGDIAEAAQRFGQEDDMTVLTLGLA